MKKHERKARLAHLRPYVAELQALLRLQGWEIEVVEEPPEEEDALAEVNRYKRAWCADIHISDALLGRSREWQRKSLVHELLHLHLHDFYTASREAAECHPATASGWAMDRIDHEHERTTDALAVMLAPLLPLPPETKE